MQDATTTERRDELSQRIQAADSTAVRTFLTGLDPAERARALARLADDELEALLVLVTPEDAASLVGHLPEVLAVDAIGNLVPEDAARILEELPSATQADVIGELDRDEAEAILTELPQEDARDVRALCQYDDDEAGGLMRTECLRYAADDTVGEVVSDLMEGTERYEGFDTHYLFVTDRDGRLTGVLSMRNLLLGPPGRPLASLLKTEPLHVLDTDRLETLVAFFDQHRFFVAPVVDDWGRLLGIVRRSAVEEAQAEASDKVYLQSLGIVGGEELRTMPVWRRSRRRLTWLSANVLLNVAAASVIAMNRDTLQSAIALAIFLPVISDMSGCSGNQAVAVSIRELTLGVIRPSELFRVWRKELSVGLISAACLGAMLALVAWAYEGDTTLALVVGTALAVNTLVAVSLGGVLPLILKKWDRDPALASGPILTTVTDLCGFLLALGLAAAFLT